jgi:C_GCAxxG_C_C family probable redox protein
MQLDEHLAARRAPEHLNSGLHCAESVLLAVLEGTEAGRDPLIPRVASCFGGGVGRSREELCGALAGGLMAMGCLAGRDHAGQPSNLISDMAADLRKQFLAIHGCTRCAAIREAMGPQVDFHLCKQLSGTAAALTCRVLNEFLG